MGLRGPAPKPSAIERAEGFPGKRKRNTEEPQPTELTVAEVKRRCPKHLKGEERRWWRYYGELLTPLRVITETDLVAMEALARTTTERIAQEEQLRKSGPLYKSKSGYIQVSPLFSVVSTLRERELKLLREFGMTPSSRTRVQVAREEGMEDIWAILSQPRRDTEPEPVATQAEPVQ